VSDIRIVSKSATAEEIAAVTAVLSAALEELADAQEASSGPTVSAWQRSQVSIRPTLVRGRDTWRGFSG